MSGILRPASGVEEERKKIRCRVKPCQGALSFMKVGLGQTNRTNA